MPDIQPPIQPPPSLPPIQQPPAVPAIIDSGRPCKEYQYAVKVVSGVPKEGIGIEKEIVAPGRYFTAVNIHNPSTCKTVTFRWKVAVATPAGFPFGRITRFQKITLRPDQAVEIDTPNIARLLRVETVKFIKGFVVIESPCELDVVAVTTVGSVAAQPTNNGAIALHTERVPARVIDACHEDLDLDISTGVAPWMLTSAIANSGAPFTNITTPRPANVIENDDRHPAWGTQSCGRWIGVRGVAHDLRPPIEPGTYTFQHCFSLCSGFENARIEMSILVDDNAVIWLNDHKIAPPPAITGYNGTPKVVTITNQDFFLPGQNCISFVVTNIVGPGSTGNPVGINVCGRVRAERGACDQCGCASDCGCSGSKGKQRGES